MPIIFFPLSALINLITSIAVAAVVMFNNFHNTLNKTFALFALSVAFWSLFYFFWQIAPDRSSALLYCKILMIGAIFIPSTFFHFTVYLIEEPRRYLKLIIIFYILSVLFLLIDFSSLLVLEVKQRLLFKFWPVAGELYLPYLCFFGGVVILAHILLIKYFNQVTGIKRNRIKYVFLGTAIGFIGGSTNYPLWFNINILPYGNIFVSVYVFLVAFSIIKHRLMDIRLVISNTAIFIIVYAFVLGIPFVFGYKYHQWEISTWAMLILATTGPFLLFHLQKRAADQFLKEEKRIQDILEKLSAGLTIINDLRQLLTLIQSVLVRNLKLEHMSVYLLESGINAYVLKSSYPVTDRVDTLPVDDYLIQTFKEKKYPILYEEAKFLSEGIKRENIEAANIASSMKKLSAAVVIPIIGKKSLLGIILLSERPEKLLYSTDLIKALSVVGRSVAFSLEIIMFMAERDRLLTENFRKSRFESLALLCASVSHQIDNRFHGILYSLAEPVNIFNTGKYKDYSKEDFINLIEDLGLGAKESLAIARDGATVTKGILDYSKSKVEFGLVDFDSIVDSSLKFVQLKRGNQKIELKKEYPKDTILWASQAILNEVLANAIDNSWFAMNEKKEHFKDPNYSFLIVIRGHTNTKMFHFELEDNGMGIKKDNIHKVFDPFFSTKGTLQGTGMGTTVMLQFIEQHGGTIAYESEYEKWTKVKISLPLATEEQKRTKNV